MFASVEPCQTITVRGDRHTKQLVLRKEERQCKHLYFYFLDPQFGLLHIRLQTWFPFSIQVCINGRRWLANRLKRAGLSFIQHDNTFTHIADDSVSQPLQQQGRRYPALQPISPRESKLFDAVCQGQFLLHGFRNKDLRHLLPRPTQVTDRQFTLQITRKLRLLRAHGLIFKVAKTHYYRITKKGHDVMATAINFRAADIALLAA